MKYRIKDLQYRIQKKRRGAFKAKRSHRALPLPLPPHIKKRHGNAENINIYSLFEYGELPSAPRGYRARKLASRLRHAFVTVRRKTKTAAVFALSLLAKPFRNVGKGKPRLAFYSGALTGALLVTAISVVTVLISLFGTYLLPYDTLTVPSLVGESLSDVDTENSPFELLVSYEHSGSVPAGVIISQRPDGGVTRKIYPNTTSPCVSVTVSMGKRFYTVPRLVGISARDALLELKNNGVAADTVYEYSSAAPIGTVISTLPSEQSRIYEGERVTVRISLGKKIATVSVPDLYGLNEESARALLSAKGLLIGDISYRSSSVEAGRIISQKYSPYSSVSEGTRIDVTVSLGKATTEKTVPELYGLSLSEAKERLAEVGLVVGHVYSVSSGAPSGTVITQTPVANTPITSALTSVDLYVSS